MMTRISLAFGALAMALGLAAQAGAQTPALVIRNAPPPTLGGQISPGPPSPPHRRHPHGLAPGMVVLDRHGAKVGVITQVHERTGGRPAVRVDVNGSRFIVQSRWFKVTRSGDEAVISLTRSEIRTRAILHTD